MSDESQILVKPVNAFVHHPQRNQFLKEGEQLMDRSPWVLSKLRIGDLIEVSKQPSVAAVKTTAKVVEKVVEKTPEKTAAKK